MVEAMVAIPWIYTYFTGTAAVTDQVEYDPIEYDGDHPVYDHDYCVTAEWVFGDRRPPQFFPIFHPDRVAELYHTTPVDHEAKTRSLIGRLRCGTYFYLQVTCDTSVAMDQWWGYWAETEIFYARHLENLYAFSPANNGNHMFAYPILSMNKNFYDLDFRFSN